MCLSRDAPAPGLLQSQSAFPFEIKRTHHAIHAQLTYTHGSRRRQLSRAIHTISSHGDYKSDRARQELFRPVRVPN